ncbi:MAG: putative selenium-dependent hydroxylase accessory protein YqeC [Chloroflexi bacterium]|nr:putative selenium-dependent hydroxylase accessory protein YqeC [Chloroflexota bacterium]
MNLSTSFRLQLHDVIAFVGAGGKTTAMFRLAEELVTQGKKIIVTTTTKLGADQVETWHAVSLQYDASNEFIVRVREALQTNLQILIVSDDLPDNKVSGVSTEFIDELAASKIADVILYEADGARMLPFKAPASHEPVVASSTMLLVPVIGISALGLSLDDAHVHRADRVARLAGAQMGDPVTPLMVARVLAHSDGGVKNKPEAARVIALVNQVEDDAQLSSAREIAHLLLGYNSIDAVAIGAVKNAEPIRETHRRVAAIVLAAGAGTRMIGQVKQLLPWRGKTLIENAIDIAAKSIANETLVVLGARAEEIRAVIRNAPARVVLNRDWQVGHSTSIRAGLNALSKKIDAAIFINADQPLLTSEVVNAVIQRYRETDAGIVTPEYAGKRGSPVLFDRRYFQELSNLQGEEGGREVLLKYPAERVQFTDARLGSDVDTIEEYNELT